MDHRPNVGQPAPAGGRVILRAFQPRPRPLPEDESTGATVTCDQAIFTSIRSPMGEGYRIVAASSGVKPQEKAEITRRSPSHGGLCSSEPDAVGLVAYPLPTGRYCVAHCSYAGIEHTARGGLRVVTHVAILDRTAFGAFACNPALVHRSLGQTPELPKAGRGSGPLDPLTLSIRDNLSARPAPDRAEAGRLRQLAASLLGEGRWIMHGMGSAITALDWAFECVPHAHRVKACVSAGVKFAPSRQTVAALIDGDPTEARRAICGHAVQWADASTSLPAPAGQFDGWLELVREHAECNRLPHVARLARQMTEAPPAETLNRIATLTVDRAKVEHFDEDGLRNLQQRHSGATPTYHLEAELRSRLLERIAERLSEMNDGQIETV